MKRSNRSILPFVYRHKKYLILCTIAIGLVGIVAYIFLSAQAWKAYEQSYVNWHTGIRSQLNTTLSLPDLSEDDKAKKLKVLKDFSTKISQKKSLCNLPIPMSWQRVIDSVKKREEACLQQLQEMIRFDEKLTVAVLYLENDHAVSSLLLSMNPEEKLMDSTWQSERAKWGATKNTLQEYSVQVQFKPVLLLAIEKVSAIENSWQGLLAAHAEKNKIKYQDAQVQLGKAYEGLKEIPIKSMEQFNSIVSEVSDAYGALQ